MHRLILSVALLAFVWPAACAAKRARPQEVPPVLTATLRIEAPLDNGRVARIEAFDRAGGPLLWSLVVFENEINPELEEDAQWRFIRTMVLVGDQLEIVAEGGARYQLDLVTRKVGQIVTPHSVVKSPPPPAARGGRGPSQSGLISDDE